MRDRFCSLVAVELVPLIALDPRDRRENRQLLTVDGKRIEGPARRLTDRQRRHTELVGTRGHAAPVVASSSGRARCPARRRANTWRLWNPRRLFRSVPRKMITSIP